MQLEDFVGRISGGRLHNNYVMGLCPFHDDHSPSLAVYENGGFVCFACGAKGPWAQLWDALEGGHNTWNPAPKNLNWIRPGWNHVKPSDYAKAMHTSLLSLPTYQHYLEDRGVSDMIRPCMLGYDQGWYIIPLHKVGGGPIIGLIGRASPETEQETGFRFDIPFGQGALPFSPDWNKLEQAAEIYITFGIFDALALGVCQYAVITPTTGKNSTDPDWLNSYSKKIYILHDDGEDEAAYETAGRLDWRGEVASIQYNNYKSSKDPADILKNHGQGELINAITESVRDLGGIGTP